MRKEFVSSSPLGNLLMGDVESGERADGELDLGDTLRGEVVPDFCFAFKLLST